MVNRLLYGSSDFRVKPAIAIAMRCLALSHGRCVLGFRGPCALEDGQDELQDKRYNLLRRSAAGGLKPLLHGAVNGPTRGGGDHLWWNPQGGRRILQAAITTAIRRVLM